MAPSTPCESQPLLRNEASSGDHLPEEATKHATLARPLRVVIPGILMLFLSEWCSVFIRISMGALMERAICQRQYPNVVDSLHDPRCKSGTVQAELFTVSGWESSFILIPALLTAIPYNMMAEAYGPKLVVLLMVFGQLLAHSAELIVCLLPHVFNTRWVWLCATFVVVGGGPVVLTSMIYYIGNSISTEKNRATTFLYCTAIRMVGGLTGGPVAFLLMKNGPVFTKCMALGIGAAMFGLQLIMPGDLIRRRAATVPRPQPAQSHAPAATSSMLRRTFSTCKQGLGNFRNLVLSDVKTGIYLLTVMVYTIAGFSALFRFQYAALRFGWSWAAASFLASIASGVRLAMVGAILPATSYYLVSRCGVSGFHKDMWMSRFLVALLLLGSFALAVAPTGRTFIAAICLSELSAGHVQATVSLITSMTDETHKGMVFGYVAVFEAIGGIVSGPLLASLFSLGLDWGARWYGLPFMFVGTLQVLVLVILFTTAKNDAKMDTGGGSPIEDA